MGNGFVQITLSDASTDVLSRVEGMRKWHVGPTMLRGSQKSLDDLPKVKAKQDSNTDGKQNKKDMKDKKLKKQKTKTLPAETSVPLDITVETLSRGNPLRHDAIKNLLREIFHLDTQLFGQSPLFDGNGKCRMKFIGADQVSINQILDQSSLAFETM